MWKVEAKASVQPPESSMKPPLTVVDDDTSEEHCNSVIRHWSKFLDHDHRETDILCHDHRKEMFDHRLCRHHMEVFDHRLCRHHKEVFVHRLCHHHKENHRDVLVHVPTLLTRERKRVMRRREVEFQYNEKVIAEEVGKTLSYIGEMRGIFTLRSSIKTLIIFNYTQ